MQHISHISTYEQCAPVHVHYNTRICGLKERDFWPKITLLILHIPGPLLHKRMAILFYRVIVKSDNSFDLKVLKTFKYTERL